MTRARLLCALMIVRRKSDAGEASGLDDSLAGEAEAGANVSRVDHQRADIDERGIVDQIVVCADQRRVDPGERLPSEWGRAAAGELAMFARRRDLGDERVVILDNGAALFEQFHDLQRRAL